MDALPVSARSEDGGTVVTGGLVVGTVVGTVVGGVVGCVDGGTVG